MTVRQAAVCGNSEREPGMGRGEREWEILSFIRTKIKTVQRM